MGQVFVSYAHRNQKPVSRIATALAETGYQVWWDQRLRAHQDFGMEIEAALRNARCAIVAWSTEARDSLWVRAEATEAWESRKLVQVSLDGAKPPLPFTMIHLLNLSNWSGRTGDPPWADLKDAVDAVISGVAPHAVSREPPARLGGFGGTALLGAGSLVLVLACASLVGAAAAGGLSSGRFAVLIAGMLLASLLAFAYMVIRIVKVLRASR